MGFPRIAGMQTENRDRQMTPAPVQVEPARLSLAQERVWLLERFATGSDFYNIPFAIRIRSLLDMCALRRAVQALLARHEALRTHVEENGNGVPLQVISRPQAIDIPMTDLSARPAEERESELQHLLAQEAARPFELSQPPLLRIGLIRLAPSDHLLYLTFHHIIADGWSISVMCRDLGELYQADVQERAAELPSLPITYREHALRQRERLQGAVLRQQLDFWESTLAGAPTVLELPIDKPRPAMQSYRCDHCGFSTDDRLSAHVRALGGKDEVTPFILFLAAIGLRMARYSGQDDILIGFPAANREAFETEELVGCFINTLVLRIKPFNARTFRELLRQVRDSAVEVLAHQDTPLEKLVEVLRPDRDTSRHPLFQVMVNSVTDAAAAPLPAGWSAFYGERKTSKKEHTKKDSRRERQFFLNFEYATDLFVRSTIQRLADHLQGLLTRAVEDPDGELRQISILTDTERHALLDVWSGSHGVGASDGSLLDLYCAQVARTPHGVALAQGDRILTYSELEARANQLAHYLIGLGVHHEMPVGVHLRRDFEWVACVLAILKAGACYVPLDVGYPRERLAHMVDSSGAKLVLTGSHLTASAFGVPVVELDREASEIWRQLTTTPACTPDPDQLAYILFTSGSTGRPKGAMIRHRSAVSYLRHMSRVFDLSATDGVLQVTSPSFDPSIRELFATLTSGARLILLPDSPPGDPSAISDALQSGAVSKIIGVTPSMLKLLLAHMNGAGGPLCRLSLICPSGEALESSLCESLRRAFGRKLRIANLFGPPETTMTCSSFEVPPEVPVLSCVPIGLPIANSRCYVLDSRGELVPVGIAGELYVGGIGVGRGYVHQPGLTAERFVPNPFARGERRYRTGDRVRWLAEGILEFQGRLDYQLKIRGYRIEPGEIESVIREDTAISEVVVVCRELAPDDQCLVAYLVRAGNASLDVEALRGRLRKCMPAHMVPSIFTVLERLPLTPNGKVDRKGLPPPDARLVGAVYEAPCTPLEQLLSEIWQELLQVRQVGRHDSFFDLGGHSLLVTRVVAHIRERLRVELPLRSVFETPRLFDLAKRLEQQVRESAGVAVPALSAQVREGHVPLS